MTASHARAELLDQDTVVAYLRGRGLLDDQSTRVRELDGGVSNTVLSVESAGHAWVVKQSLPTLRVAQEWRAKQERTLNEARGLAVAARLTPGHVPGVVDVDPERFVLVIERAPDGLTPWKGLLLQGVVHEPVAATLGRLLGTWHHATAADPALVEGLDDPEAFDQLRVEPYHLATAQALPDVRDAVLAVADAMAARRICLVHGDFSPKNILTGPGGTWVLDFEVAHRGDPDFDVAFLVTHLLLKAVHRPAHRGAYAAAAAAFLRAYSDATRPLRETGLQAEPEHLVAHVGVLLLARTDGRSPAEYLTAPERDIVRRVGRRVLTRRPPSVPRVWDVLAEEADR
ncbi:phosphotransferase [Pseudonocardia nigra]|uniref:phosphotransferase n=1 Tax=Pseudonocardia nigra TaxID=1921578 RepID=UPI001C5D3F7A|nr:phosphotransferase [Pseudonocardia nigra]